MNACEDQSEPLGEHIDTLTAIQRGAVVGILSAADEVLATKQLAERQTVALNGIRRYVDSAAERWAAQQPMPPYWELFNDIRKIIDEAGA
ncbi:hypothetical protein [Mycolicibacterium fortuitum]|uniref:hypothetical protein n=1 Tax=Mycolicibacterium fortuitum TaxID=1766 RepID=UPI003AACCAE6